ncbi:hypothetical protein QFZ24_009022 [Streptomyces phaeochromogenes]|uniref:hypothetical protein n=1 Tax=Streptomyces TaxID=1883 RepID=UPI00117C89B8|nr:MULTISPECIES: hypothetical protein [Streptomyces]MDQ0955099.1 hypothetical protein [Streptomyces phaeochromogenes]TRO59157.1 hypothetical protein E4K73_35500 [Streptomyces sp. IB201691-2A2]
MDSTFATTGPFLGREGQDRPSVELAGAHWTDPPIYAALVADWRARGRVVPRRRETRRPAFTAVRPTVVRLPGPGRRRSDGPEPSGS